MQQKQRETTLLRSAASSEISVTTPDPEDEFADPQTYLGNYTSRAAHAASRPLFRFIVTRPASALPIPSAAAVADEIRRRQVAHRSRQHIKRETRARTLKNNTAGRLAVGFFIGHRPKICSASSDDALLVVAGVVVVAVGVGVGGVAGGAW